MEPMMTMKTASNAVFSASERLLPSLTIIRVAMKTITPRTETWRNVNSLGSVPIQSNVWSNLEDVFMFEGSFSGQDDQSGILIVRTS